MRQPSSTLNLTQLEESAFGMGGHHPLQGHHEEQEGEGEGGRESRGDSPEVRREQPATKRNDIIGSPSDVALLRYVELVASVEGIRQRYQASVLFLQKIYFYYLNYLIFILFLFIFP